MKRKLLLFLALLELYSVQQVLAQDKNNNFLPPADTTNAKILVSQPRRFYMGNGYDLFMFSTANLTQLDRSKLTPVRFTAVVNIGLNFHYDLNKRFGLFTGISLKNLGLIEKSGNTTTKHRVYTVGVPLGLKIGNLRDRNFVFGGGGIDVPFNYRVKIFNERHKKTYKDSEWFSDRTASVMPYAFLGLSVDPGLIVKAQYYPANFFNQDFKEATGYKTYSNMTASIFSLSLSVDIHYNQYKIQEREYRKMKAERENLKAL
ncbi:MAG TPA: hypothetical protein VL098_12510 [Flavipsychrobacter sp.]|nr:hypothetical protein [Flavipsychrobacter sp.]